jgi:hypothetical protein
VKPPNSLETIKGMFQDNFRSSPFSCFFFCSLLQDLFCSFPLCCVAGRVCERWSVIFLKKEGAAVKLKGRVLWFGSLFFTDFFFFLHNQERESFSFSAGLAVRGRRKHRVILQKNRERMEERRKEGNRILFVLNKINIIYLTIKI